MKKRMLIMLIGVAIIASLIFFWKLLGYIFLQRYIASSKTQRVTVSASPIKTTPWLPKITAAASLRAVRGVNVTTQLAGMVDKIYFVPGTFVEAGAVLVQLNADTDIAQLHSLEAQEELARVTYERDKQQYAVHAISKATLDTDVANVKSFRAQVEEQKATVAKKTIVAPFAGRLGVSAVNPGQFLNPGDKVVSLQSLDPIWADFFVPQQTVVRLKLGQPVTITVNAYPGKAFTGKITTIDPSIEVSTRNAQVEATIGNPDYELVPGMFATAEVIVGEAQNFLTLPQSAISFNPYGQLVFVVRDKGKDKGEKSDLVANQVFVTTGETRGDQIQILSGLKEGELVVTSGQLKLKNGTPVSINNKIVPANSPNPQLSNEH